MFTLFAVLKQFIHEYNKLASVELRFREVIVKMEKEGINGEEYNLFDVQVFLGGIGAESLLIELYVSGINGRSAVRQQLAPIPQLQLRRA